MITAKSKTPATRTSSASSSPATRTSSASNAVNQVCPWHGPYSACTCVLELGV